MTSDRSSLDTRSQHLPPQDKPPHQLSTPHVYRFLGGAGLGAVMVAVPYSVAPIPLDPFHAGIATLFILTCGLFTRQFGPSFIETISKVLADTGLY